MIQSNCSNSSSENDESEEESDDEREADCGTYDNGRAPPAATAAGPGPPGAAILPSSSLLHVGGRKAPPVASAPCRNEFASCAPSSSSPPPRKEPPKQSAAAAADRSNTPSSAEERWEDMFSRLLQYREISGDCHVPNRYQQDPKLGAWVSTQRRHYRVAKTQKKGESTSLTAERIRRLEAAGFEWTGVNPRYLQWDVRYEEMVQFKEKYGHTNIPIGWPENVRLANWTSTQRQEYKNKLKGRKSRMDDRRIQLLNDIGFSWELQRGGRKRKLMASQEGRDQQQGSDSDGNDDDDDDDDDTSSSSSSSSEEEDAGADAGDVGHSVAPQVEIGESRQSAGIPPVGIAESSGLSASQRNSSKGTLGIHASGEVQAGLSPPETGPGAALPAVEANNSTSNIDILGSLLWSHRPQPGHDFTVQQSLQDARTAQLRALIAEDTRVHAQARAEAAAAAANSFLANRVREITQVLQQRQQLQQLQHRNALISGLLQRQSIGALSQPHAALAASVSLSSARDNAAAAFLISNLEPRQLTQAPGANNNPALTAARSNFMGTMIGSNSSAPPSLGSAWSWNNPPTSLLEGASTIQTDQFNLLQRNASNPPSSSPNESKTDRNHRGGDYNHDDQKPPAR